MLRFIYIKRIRTKETVSYRMATKIFNFFFVFTNSETVFCRQTYVRFPSIYSPNFKISCSRNHVSNCPSLFMFAMSVFLFLILLTFLFYIYVIFFELFSRVLPNYFFILYVNFMCHCIVKTVAGRYAFRGSFLIMLFCILLRFFYLDDWG